MENIIRGIPAGILIAAVVWMMPMSRSFSFFMILFFTYFISLGDFAHIVVGSCEMAYAVFHVNRKLKERLYFIDPALQDEIRNALREYRWEPLQVLLDTAESQAETPEEIVHAEKCNSVPDHSSGSARHIPVQSPGHCFLLPSLSTPPLYEIIYFQTFLEWNHLRLSLKHNRLCQLTPTKSVTL